MILLCADCSWAFPVKRVLSSFLVANDAVCQSLSCTLDPCCSFACECIQSRCVICRETERNCKYIVKFIVQEGEENCEMVEA